MEGKFCQSCGASQGPEIPGAAASASATSQAGLPENMAAALCYLLGFVTGVLFLVIPPYNQNPAIRFHAFQSIFFHVGWIALTMAVGIFSRMLRFLSILLLPVPVLLGVGGFGLWLYLMWRAYNNQPLELPIVGPLAREQASRR